MGREAPKYVLDANVFIESARRYYAFDIVPAFWDCLTRLVQEGKIVSIDRVQSELNDNKDPLSDWANGSFHTGFVSTNDPAVLKAYQKVIQWAYGEKQFTDAAKAEFAKADNADAWLVAYAMVNDCTIVTHEVLDPNIKRIIKIPNACKQFGVRCVNTFEMLRELGVKLK